MKQLSTTEQIEYKLALVVYRCPQSLVSPYLASDLQNVSTSTHGSVYAVRWFMSSSFYQHFCPRRWPRLLCGRGPHVEQSAELCDVVIIVVNTQKTSYKTVLFDRSYVNNFCCVLAFVFLYSRCALPWFRLLLHVKFLAVFLTLRLGPPIPPWAWSHSFM